MTIPPIGIGPLGANQFSVGGLGTSVPSPTATASGATSPAGGGQSFGAALTSAIGSLENTQAAASQAAQQLATGQATNPTTAVTAVENASLAMTYAAQIRSQIDNIATTLFQTQV
jgi:flagellar hook-basal body complex protein FliE